MKHESRANPTELTLDCFMKPDPKFWYERQIFIYNTVLWVSWCCGLLHIFYGKHALRIGLM